MNRFHPRQWPGAPRRLLQRISRKNRLLAGILGLTVLATGTLMATAPSPQAPVAEEKAWPVSVVAVEATSLSPELRLFGRVESPHHAHLSAAVAAQVTRVHVQEGQRVRQGQLLASLDPSEERLKLQQAEAVLLDAEAQLATVKTDHVTHQRVLAHMQELYDLTSTKAERLKNLNQRQLIATEQMENTLQEVARQGIELARQQALVDKHPQRLASAQSTVESARAAVETQRLNLERTGIHSPFDGRVSAVEVSPGDRVTIGAPLLSLYDTGALRVRTALPSGNLDALKQALDSGRAVTATTRDSDVPLTLIELAAAVTSGRSGVDGLFRLPPGGGGLELGRAVEVQLVLPAVDNVVALPLQSLYNNNRIFLVEDDRLRGVSVSPRGQRINDRGELQVLVDAGRLPPQSRVLASNLPKAASGLRVRAVGPEVASTSAGEAAAQPGGSGRAHPQPG